MTGCEPALTAPVPGATAAGDAAFGIDAFTLDDRLRLFQGSVNLTPVPAVANSAWRMAIGTQKFGFYLRRRSEAVYVDFTTVALSSDDTVTHVSTMPPMMPPSIKGTVRRAKVITGETPRLTDASSRLGSI